MDLMYIMLNFNWIDRWCSGCVVELKKGCTAQFSYYMPDHIKRFLKKDDVLWRENGSERGRKFGDTRKKFWLMTKKKSSVFSGKEKLKILRRWPRSKSFFKRPWTAPPAVPKNFLQWPVTSCMGKGVLFVVAEGIWSQEFEWWASE